jgi:hypothetical protein
LLSCKLIKELTVHKLYRHPELRSPDAYLSFISKTPTIYLKHVRELSIGSASWRGFKPPCCRYPDYYSHWDGNHNYDFPRTLNHFAPSASRSLKWLAKRILREAREAQHRSGGEKIETVLDYLSQPVIIHLNSPIKGAEWFGM